jgi:2-polyprenyl-3-methyl-5-hydroxy-6-metoxy-1,4-benzoquinol methylase
VSGRANANLDSWGGDERGPLNGSSGEGLATKLVGIVEQQSDVRTICDLGCGNGYLAGRLGARGYQVTGVDASQPYVDTAIRTYASERVRFRRAHFTPELLAELAGRQFDLVISSDVIEHLYQPTILTETAAAIVKPGGLFVAGTPYHGYLKNLALAVRNDWDEHHSVHWDGGHIKFFSVKTLRRMIDGAGFEVLRFHFYGRLPWLWKNMICVARKRG